MSGTDAVPAPTSTTDLAEPVSLALQARSDGRRVLVVFDVDDTLLTMPQDLGSDAWFNAHARDPGGIGGFERLIRVQRLLFEAGEMSTTQRDAAELVRLLHRSGVAVYALSARGHDMRDATESALRAAGIDLGSAPECGAPLCVRRGRIEDNRIRAALRTAGISAAEAPFRAVTVSDGLMLASGQDKGLLLRLLLASLPDRYDLVVFVDDSARNVEAVHHAAVAAGLPLRAFRYERMWERAEGFATDAERRARAESDLATVLAGVCRAVRSGLCASPAGD